MPNTLQIKKDLQKVKKNGEIFGKFKKSPYLCIVLGEILTQQTFFKQTKTIYNNGNDNKRTIYPNN